MKKRALSLVMAAAVAGTMLTGCGSTEGEKTADKKDMAILPGGLSGLFIAYSAMEGTANYLPSGIGCAVALVVVWWIGRVQSEKHEKEELDKMKTKDL